MGPDWGVRWKGEGGGGGFFGGAMGGVAAPAVAAAVKTAGAQKKQEETGQNGKQVRRRWNALLGFGRMRGQMFGAGEIVLAEESFFIEAQVARDGTHEPVAEDAAGQLGPIFIFQGLDETGADARGLGEFVHGNFAQLALALQAFTKISPGHEPEPVLDNPSATAKLMTRRALAKKQRGIPERTISGGIRECQTEKKTSNGPRKVDN